MRTDHFSNVSKQYVTFRPNYPIHFLQFVLSQVRQKENAWDVGTGNGQVAVELAKVFDQVMASDISASQIAQAPVRDNIQYSIGQAQKTKFPDHSFDLITVAQALHWFEFEPFFHEVRRCLKPDGVLAVWTYNLFRASNGIDAIIDDFYHNVIGTYWPEERKYVDTAYDDIPWPSDMSTSRYTFNMELNYSRESLMGYISTWSAVKNYLLQHDDDVLTELNNKLSNIWPDQSNLMLTFPITLYLLKNE